MPRLRGGEQARSRKLARELERAAASDPSLRPLAEPGPRPGPHRRRQPQRSAAACATVAGEVNGGMNRLVPGGERLEAGVGKLAEATDGLSGGLDRLGDGAERLSSGLVELQGGAGALRSGLAEGSRRAYPLQAKLADAGAAGDRGRDAAGARRPKNCAASRPASSTPATSSSPPSTAPRPRSAAEAGEAISVDGGGQAARMLVVSDYPFNSAGSREDRRAARRPTPQRLATASGLRTGVTGGAATLNTYGEATEARLPLVIGAFVLFTLLALIVILRAPLLALLDRLPQPRLGGGGDRGDDPGLPDPRGLPARRPPLHRHGRRGGDLRRHLRALDRLRGLPHRPHARALRASTATTGRRSPSGWRRPPG